MLQWATTTELGKGRVATDGTKAEKGLQFEETPRLLELQANLEATGTLKTSEYQRMLAGPIPTHLWTTEAI